MGGHDLVKLTEPFKPNQDHESFVEFRMQGSRGVTGWFVKRHVQTEQRREEEQECGRPGQEPGHWSHI